jgi:hypothetical protein
LGKSTLENYLGLMEPAHHPLERVHINIYSPSVTSIEGYNHALISRVNSESVSDGNMELKPRMRHLVCQRDDSQRLQISDPIVKVPIANGG